MDEPQIISILLPVAAVVAQLAAAFFALRLILITGNSVAWPLIAGALCIMAMRRTFTLARVLGGYPGYTQDPVDDFLALMISLVMLAGVIAIRPLFLTIKKAAEVLQQDKEDLEIKVAQRTEELARSNAELEQFANVASHDLQEPLRMVASFTQLLAKRYQGKLDKDADEFIDYAVDGATRMQQLLNDLLTYARVGTRAKPPAPVDLNEVVVHTETNLIEAIKESGAVVTQGPLPTVAGDEVQLTQLFQNLLANAIKFRTGNPPWIHISARFREGHWVISVQDNGIGIAPEHRERIFAIFQRLHPRHEYPGTGIGLALCKKIVERHGGHIWVESASSQGAGFYFSLPGSEKQ